VGNGWSGGSPRQIARELRAQADPEERARRLRAYKERCEAVTLDGETCEPLGDGFVSARLVDVKP
jgi:hypothetical protein